MFNQRLYNGSTPHNWISTMAGNTFRAFSCTLQERLRVFVVFIRKRTSFCRMKAIPQLYQTFELFL